MLAGKFWNDIRAIYRNFFLLLTMLGVRTMTQLFSYVVDHDHGYAPNPFNGICTLVHCKFGGLYRKRNIVEMADEGDWILGSGGSSRQSAGLGKIIYFMRVDEKLEFGAYLNDRRFRGRDDHNDWGNGNLFALVSFRYFYFGKNALDVLTIPQKIPLKGLFKKGPGYRRDFPLASLKALIKWFGKTYEIGMHGDPCTSNCTSLKTRFRPTTCSTRTGASLPLRTCR